MTTWTNPEECLSDLVKLLHAWWEAARGSADVPDRADLRPEEMKPLLPFLFIADAEHDPFPGAIPVRWNEGYGGHWIRRHWSLPR